MAQEKGTPRKFTIPTVDEVYGSEAAAVRPLFKPSGTLAAPRGGEGAEVSSDDGRLSGRRRGSAGTTASAEGPPQAPAGDLAAKPSAKHSAIVVSPRQRGNPVLKFVRNVPWEFGETTADYILGQTTCALYLSLRYHCLNQDYIHKRLKALGNAFALRLLLVLVDKKDPQHELKELAKISLLADCTLILAWSCEEAGRYLETYKAFENKPADFLKERVDSDFVSKVTECLTTVKSVNKTDALTLLNVFKSIGSVIEASREELTLCPGLGPQKARRLFEVFHEPFLRGQKLDPPKPRV